MPCSLGELASLHGTDKGPDGHGYTDHYERLLTPLRRDPIRLLEIGVYRGASLRMWVDWLPNAEITGVDIDPVGTVDGPRVRTVVSDFRDVPGGSWDVVVDDGSHNPGDVVDAWHQFWPHVTPGGWYVIEDVAQAGGPLVFEHLAGVVWGRGGISELHVHPSRHPACVELNQAWQIVFVRKAP